MAPRKRTAMDLPDDEGSVFELKGYAEWVQCQRVVRSDSLHRSTPPAPCNWCERALLLFPPGRRSPVGFLKRTHPRVDGVSALIATDEGFHGSTDAVWLETNFQNRCGLGHRCAPNFAYETLCFDRDLVGPSLPVDLSGWRSRFVVPNRSRLNTTQHVRQTGNDFGN